MQMKVTKVAYIVQIVDHNTLNVRKNNKLLFFFNVV